MELSYEQAIQQTGATEGQEVTAAQRKWIVSEKALTQYQVVKRTAAQKTLKAYRSAKGLKARPDIKEEGKE